MSGWTGEGWEVGRGGEEWDGRRKGKGRGRKEAGEQDRGEGAKQVRRGRGW